MANALSIPASRTHRSRASARDDRQYAADSAWRRSRPNSPASRSSARPNISTPAASVKDRAALNMVLDGERSGKLNHNRTILDSTSGNTGIAYAMIGANRGYKVKLVLPGNASRGAQAHPQGVRRRDASSAIPTKAPTARSAWSARSTWRIRTAISIPTSTTIRPTGRRISRAPARRSSSRPAAG